MKTTLSIAAVLAFAITTSSAQAPATVFEGGRVIIGDGRLMDNATIVVVGERITQVGGAASVKGPAGATRVSLAGKTVMPALVDTHVHTSTTAPELVTDLKQRAYFGVGAAMSLGLDGTDAPYRAARQGHARARALLPRRPRHHGAREGPHRGALLDHHRRSGAQGRAGDGGEEGRHREDLG